jgi:hypothetical protein
VIEAIIDVEDRELISSLGHWTGDPTWEPGPILGQLGVMDFLCVPFGPEKTTSLTYPYFKLPKNRDCVFDVMAAKVLSVVGDPFFHITITDGVGTNIDLLPDIYPFYAWSHTYHAFTTPPEWNQPTGSILITVYNPDEAEGSVYVDFFSLQYEVPAKIQYLPIMGVG